MHRLRRRDRGVGIAHRGHGDGAGLEHEIRLHAEEHRFPQHEVGDLARGDGADLRRDAMGERRIDGVFRDVALHAQIVVVADLFGAGGRAVSSSCRRSARFGSAPRRRGPSPGCPTRSSRTRRCRAGCPPPRWSPCGYGFRRRRRPPGCACRDDGRPSACRDARRSCSPCRAGSDWCSTAARHFARELDDVRRMAAAGALGVESMDRPGP